jgi:hypothetical protein
MHPRFILRICTSEALYLEIDILPSLIETCCADASIQWILPRRSKDHNLSLHNIIILANEARGESACIMYASFPSQMSIRDLHIIIIAGEFFCFRLRLTMDTMPSVQHMRQFGRK